MCTRSPGLSGRPWGPMREERTAEGPSRLVSPVPREEVFLLLQLWHEFEKQALGERHTRHVTWTSLSVPQRPHLAESGHWLKTCAPRLLFEAGTITIHVTHKNPARREDSAIRPSPGIPWAVQWGIQTREVWPQGPSSLSGSHWTASPERRDSINISIR